MKAEYVRVKLLNQWPTKPFWAKKTSNNEFIQYIRCNREGDTILGNKKHIIIVTKEDIAWERPARMSRKYGELEIIKDDVR